MALIRKSTNNNSSYQCLTTLISFCLAGKKKLSQIFSAKKESASAPVRAGKAFISNCKFKTRLVKFFSIEIRLRELVLSILKMGEGVYTQSNIVGVYNISMVVNVYIQTSAKIVFYLHTIVCPYVLLSFKTSGSDIHFNGLCVDILFE